MPRNKCDGWDCTCLMGQRSCKSFNCIRVKGHRGYCRTINGFFIPHFKNDAYCRVGPAEGDQILREDLANHPNFMEVDNA